MQSKPKGPKKGQTHPLKPKRIRVSIFSILKKWYTNQNSSAPSNRLQKINIWFTMLFTVVVGILAWMTFVTTTEIKGMKEVLTTFSASVRGHPTLFKVNVDTIIGDVELRNYGTRPAFDIQSYGYMIMDTSIVERPTRRNFDALGSGERLGWTFEYYTPGLNMEKVNSSIFILKLVYKDQIINAYDSTYSYSTDLLRKNNINKITFLNKEDAATIRRRLKEKFPDF